MLALPLAKAQTQVAVITEHAPPLQYFFNGKVEGKTTDIVRALLKEAEIDTKIQIYPWARSFQLALDEPNTLIYPMIRSKEREDRFIWLGELLTFNLSFISLSNNKHITINNISDAKNYRLAVMRDDYIHHLLLQHGFKEQMHFKTVSQFPQLLTLLYAKKIDALIADHDLLIELATTLNYDASLLKEVYKIPDQKLSVHLAANKQSSPELILKLKTAMKKVKQ